MANRQEQLIDCTVRLVKRINKGLRDDYPTLSYGWFAIALLNMAMRQSLATTDKSKHQVVEIWLSLLSSFRSDEFLEFLSSLLVFDDNEREDSASGDEATAQVDKIADIVVNLVNDEFKEGVSGIDIGGTWFAIGVALFMKYHSYSVDDTVSELSKYIKTVPFEMMDMVPIEMN